VRGGLATTFSSTWLGTGAYSGDGARVKKQTGSMLIRYAGGLEYHITDGAQAKYITVGGLPVATRVGGRPRRSILPSWGPPRQ
jgi:hypothetical protein